MTCCLSYGHGLGDIVYFVPLWGFTFAYFIALVFFRKKVLDKGFIPVLFSLILSFFVLNILFFKGPECSCNLFNKEKADSVKTIKVVKDLDK